MNQTTVNPSWVPELIIAPSNILVVEDDVDIREYLGSLLEETHHVLYASNGREALSVLYQHEVDLIISDIGMPILDGFELLQSLRSEKQNFTPILFLTAHAEKASVMQALLLGVDGYITKPFESDELMARVNGLLNNNRRRKEAYAQAVSSGREPEQAQEEVENASFQSRWLKELEEIVQKEIGNANIRVPELAHKMAASERTFRNRIKQYTGFSPNEYMMEARMAKALQLLERGTYLTVTEVAHAVGLEYSSYFTKTFKERFGKAPSDYL
ncbi:MAG: response regulator [Saprospiraceae bacterium]|nr:response regulator [Saprospiraceae bacterium]